MPELPEVESFRKYFEATSLNQRIEKIILRSPTLLKDTSERALKKNLEGQSFKATFRHGKYLFVSISNGKWLMLHFGMTGDLYYFSPEEAAPEHYAMLIVFAHENQLAFQDRRKLGRIEIVSDPQRFTEEEGYGPDALTIEVDEFTTRLNKRKLAIKTALMNQKIVAGVGNEFSDEILFLSGIHPESMSNKLGMVQLKSIWKHMKKVLEDAVRHNADRDKLKQYFFLENRKAGLPCPRGNGKTQFKTVGGRSAYFCPACQKLIT